MATWATAALEFGIATVVGALLATQLGRSSARTPLSPEFFGSVAKAIDELDTVIGTRGVVPRLPLHYIPLGSLGPRPCITCPAGRSSFGLRSEIV